MISILPTHDRRPRKRRFGAPCSKVATDPCKIGVVGSILMRSNFSEIKPWGRRPALGAGSGRFESFISDFYCMIAQLVERTPVKRRVAGSSPARAAIFIRQVASCTESMMVIGSDCNPDFSRFESGSVLQVSQAMVAKRSPKA